MNELKSQLIIDAGIRIAEQNLVNAYLVKRGDSDAGSIFVKIDTLDGNAKLFFRNLSHDLENDRTFVEFVDQYPDNKIKTLDVDKRITKEVMIDRDCWVVEIEDKNGFNPFLNLDC